MFSISDTVVEKGKTSNSQGFIELQTAKKELFKLLITPYSKYIVPGKEDATLEYMEVGDRVKVVAAGVKAKGSIIASEVTVLPQFVYRPYLLRQVWMHLPPQLIKICIHLEFPTN